MKSLQKFTLMLCCLLSLTVYAQSPYSFSYQAVARNSDGTSISNKSVSFRISILQGSTNGTTQYSETHTLETDVYGIVNLAIGGGTIISGDFCNY